ncbi:MAG TPA: S9 family peptidase [Gaiellaceae bacterium]
MAVEEKARTQTAKLALEDFFKLRRPIEVAISPNGEQVAFSVSSSVAEKGKRLESHIWTGAVDGTSREATRGSGTDAAPRWSATGALAFASDRDHPGRMSVYLLGPGPGEARPVGEIAGSVEDLQWSPSGRDLLVLAADLGADRAGIQAATKIQEQDASEDDPKVTRPFEAWRRLFRVDAETGETSEVSPEGVNVFEYDWDGARTVAVCSDEPSESAWYNAYVALLDLDGREADRLYEPEWQVQTPRLVGDTVCFVEGFCSDRGVLAGEVKVLDIAQRTVRHLPTDCDVSFLKRRDDGRLWYAGLRGMGSTCGSLSLSGEVEELWSGDAVIGLRFQPRVAADDAGRTLVTVLEGPEGPPEIVALDTSAPERGWKALSELNADVPDPRVAGAWESRTWTAEDGLEIEGLLLLPSEGERPFPLIVYVHGGPTGAWSHAYLPVGSSGPLLAQEGYAVLLPNPRGSAGRGQEFARANLGDMGGGDLRDILAGVDALVEGGVVDDDRVGITGGSYGGFMSAWAVTQTDRFAASIPLAAVTDWRSFHLTTNIARFDELFLDADPYEEGGEYDARSPVVQAKKCKTPTLMLHGQEDLCVPVGQAQEMYQALVEAGVETELVVYPREGHGWFEREHLLDTWGRIRDWFGRHLGVDGS